MLQLEKSLRSNENAAQPKIDLTDMSLSKLQEMAEDREASLLQSMGSQRAGHNLATEQQKQFKNKTRLVRSSLC